MPTPRVSGEYALSCLYLNEYAKKHNDCAILLQNDDSIHAVQVTDDVGSFKALVRESNQNFESGNQLNDLGESLRAGTYSVGDEYLLVKSDMFYLRHG